MPGREVNTYKKEQNMINNIHIQNFRGIKDCTIDDLKRINLLLGYNNCGKSSVLDALFLYTSSTNPRFAMTINWVRRYMHNGPDNMILNFYQLNPDATIHLNGIYDNETKRSVAIEYHEELSPTLQVPQNNVSAGNDKIYTLSMKTTIEHADKSTETYETAIQASSSHPENTVVKDAPKTYKETLHCIYQTASDPYHDNSQLYSVILKNKQEKFVIDILKEIEPNLKDIVLADGELLVDMGFDKRIPIQVLGDGIRKLLSLIISIYYCSNGILLVDEIDNGIHYKSMPVMWLALLKAAKEYNVQLFATTHNIDSLQTLCKVVEEKKDSLWEENIRVYTLRKTSDDTLKAIKSTYKQFNHLINQEIEIR